MAADLPQKRPGKKLAAAIRQYLLHERGMSRLLYNSIFRMCTYLAHHIS